MLKPEIQILQHEILKSSVKVDDGLSADLIKIISNADFWEEQKKHLNISCKTSNRYNLMIIRYCSALQAKSAAVHNEILYDEKNGINFVLVPRQRRLREDFISIQNKVLTMK